MNRKPILIWALFAGCYLITAFGQTPQRGAPPAQSNSGTNTNISTASAPNNSANKGGSRSEEFSITIIEQVSPLGVAAKRISRSFGVPIAYEEPPWAWKEDLMAYVDTPDSRSNSRAVQERTDRKLQSARLGSIDLHMTIDRNMKSDFELAQQALGLALEDHGRRGNSGSFKLINVRNVGLSIVPVGVQDVTGKPTNASSPLDVRISFDSSKRTTAETFKIIGSAVSAASGKVVNVDVTASGLRVPVFEGGVSEIGAKNEIARDVLAKTLQEIRYGSEDANEIWWNLRYNISDWTIGKAGTYTLSFYAVMKDAISTGLEVVHGSDDMPRMPVKFPPSTKPQSSGGH